MGHHRRAPDMSTFESKESAEFNMHAAEVAVPAEKRTSPDVETAKENRQAEKKKGFFDHKIAGFPWAFFVEMVAIAIGLLVLILKVIGLI